jgi:linearmycin/streptolysin S transport system permease protein
MRAVLLVAAKDLRQRVRDRSAFVVAILAPLVLATVFSLALSNAGDSSVRFKVAVADRDRGPVARSFTGHVLPALERQGVVGVRTAASPADARRLADHGTVVASFVLPAGLTADVTAGRAAAIGVVGDVDEPIGVLVARSIADTFADDVNGVRIAVAAAGGSPALAPKAEATSAPVTVVDRSATRKRLDLKTSFAAGISVFFLFFTVQFGLASLLDERRDGTLGRLLAAPVRRTAILGGKALTSVVLGTISMVVLAVATSLILGAHWGDPLGVALLIVAGVLAATGVTALVVSFARTPEQAGYWQSIVGVVLGLLGGSFFPVYQAGGVAEQLSNLTPHAWFLRGLGDLTAGGTAADVLKPAGIILAMAAVTAGLAALRVGRTLRP